MKKYFRSLQAFTLVEVLMVLALLGILTVTSVVAMDKISNDAAFDKTYGRMLQIKTALIGDLDTNKQGLREYFGYLGDVGSLPSSVQGLQSLLTQPDGVANWGINSTSKTGMGWRGPYLPTTTGQNWLVDAWGNPIVYNTTGTPYILSYGSDGVPGGTGTAQDIEIDLTPNLTTATVYGIINTNGASFSSTATVELYAPDGNGNLQTLTTTVSASNNGYFSFSNVPFGLRAVKVSIPNNVSPTDVIGPAIISIDNPYFVIPHNYLDSAPGAEPNTCTNVSNFTQVSGTKDESATTNRIYFDLNIAQSMTINTVYIQVSNGANFQGMRIGNDIKMCDDGGSLPSGFICMSFDFFGIFGVEDTTAPYQTNPTTFPEISLRNSWTIPYGQNIGAYIQLSSISPSVDWIDLRLACNLVRIQ